MENRYKSIFHENSRIMRLITLIAAIATIVSGMIALLDYIIPSNKDSNILQAATPASAIISFPPLVIQNAQSGDGGIAKNEINGPNSGDHSSAASHETLTQQPATAASQTAQAGAHGTAINSYSTRQFIVNNK